MYAPHDSSTVRQYFCRWATRLAVCGGLSAIAVSSIMPALAQEPVPPAPEQPLIVPMPETVLTEEDVEVTLKGPLHEAFARTVTLDAVPGPRVNRQPPELIDEVPPDVQPEGENVIWIPGYWSWDDSANDFLWISGLWRDVPPGRRWVPGYWAQEKDAWQWYSGFWADAEQETVQYLPQPPENLDLGPTSPAPSDDYFWIPGCWEYNNVAYSWRPGYWAPFVNDWVWVPSSYSATPRGYVYCDGYWDYRLSRRGTCFASLRFHRHGHYDYRPNHVLNVSSLLLHLFVDSRTGCYRYGDCYNDGFATPWYVTNHRHRHYDPILTYNRWTYGSGYTTRLAGWTNWFRSHSDYRPRHTVRDQHDFSNRHHSKSWVGQAVIGTSLSRALSDGDRHGHRFQRVDESSRRRTTEWSRGIAQLRTDRKRAEAGHGRPDGHQRPSFAGTGDHGRGTGDHGRTADDSRRGTGDHGHGTGDHGRPELKLPKLSPELRDHSSRGVAGLPSFGNRSRESNGSRDGDRPPRTFGQTGSRFGSPSGRFGSSTGQSDQDAGRPENHSGQTSLGQTSPSGSQPLARTGDQNRGSGAASQTPSKYTGTMESRLRHYLENNGSSRSGQPSSSSSGRSVTSQPRPTIRPDRGSSSNPGSPSPRIQPQPTGKQGSAGGSSSPSSIRSGGTSSSRPSISTPKSGFTKGFNGRPSGSSSHGSTSKGGSASSSRSSGGSLGNALNSLQRSRSSSSASRSTSSSSSASRSSGGSSSRPRIISPPKSSSSKGRSSSASSSRSSSSRSSSPSSSRSSGGSLSKSLNQAFSRSKSSSPSRSSSSGSSRSSGGKSTPKSGFSKKKK